MHPFPSGRNSFGSYGLAVVIMMSKLKTWPSWAVAGSDALQKAAAAGRLEDATPDNIPGTYHHKLTKKIASKMVVLRDVGGGLGKMPCLLPLPESLKQTKILPVACVSPFA